MPRFQIAWLMALIALTALNLGAIRLWSAYDDNAEDTAQVLIVGGLPLANVLAVGMLFGGRHLGSRPFLRGFEVFGATSLGLYIAVASLFTSELVLPYLHLVIMPLANTFGQPYTFGQQLIIASTATAMLGLPQLIIALIGGFLSRKFKIVLRYTEPDATHGVGRQPSQAV